MLGGDFVQSTLQNLQTAREEPGALGDQGAGGAHLVLGGGGRGDLLTCLREYKD